VDSRKSELLQIVATDDLDEGSDEDGSKRRSNVRCHRRYEPFLKRNRADVGWGPAVFDEPGDKNQGAHAGERAASGRQEAEVFCVEAERTKRSRSGGEAGSPLEP
jgi:hypothetical protein